MMVGSAEAAWLCCVEIEASQEYGSQMDRIADAVRFRGAL